MKVNLSQTVKKLCNNQNMTLKDLANKMEIAPESLSRAINGNPLLSTLESIATHLDVNISELFSFSHTISLHSIIVHDNTTYIADDLNSLINNVKAICAKEGVEL